MPIRTSPAVFLAVALALPGVGAAGAAPSCAPVTVAPAVVERALSGDAVLLRDGRIVRLAGVAVPRGPGLAPIADRARRQLEVLVGGRAVLLGDRREGPDRYGRFQARLYLPPGGPWIEEAMLRAGLLLAFPEIGDRPCGSALLGAEAAGRAAGAGLWADPRFAIRRAHDSALREARNTFAIVEGEVLSTGRTAAAVYLNFGRSWSTDFTVTVRMDDAARFSSAGIDLDGLPGKTVRVRGWVVEQDGPAIWADHPEQIEVLSK